MIDAAFHREPVDPFLEGGIVGDVERRALDPCLLGLPFLLALLHELGIARTEADHGAFGHEGIDDGAADAFAAASDQHTLALQTQVHVSSEADAR